MTLPTPEPRGTAALLVNARGEYLLHLRDANKPHICDPGTWSIPGGNREDEESCRQAVERELREETGLTVPLEPLAVVDAKGPTGGGSQIQVYVGTWDGDASGLPCPEGIMFKWFPAATTVWLTMCPWTAQVIALHQQTAPAPALTPVPSSTPRPEAPPARAGGGRARPNVLGVHLYLQREDGHVLLGLRHPSLPFAGRTWHFLAGHCETEGALACLVREAEEEAGLTIAPEDVELVHTVHVRGADAHADAERHPRLQLVFRARAWSGTPEVREPDKCLEWRWFDPARLPEPLVPYTRIALDGIRAGRAYSELGW
ncbi:NUDIX domain-containing protein [Streptomyces sp. NPDC048606]|uniref:NUDIX hydrolase n=1 Tax=Streptomyces sp. NPDC048606 TaxID=3154726 RepID=UPI00343E2B2A